MNTEQTSKNSFRYALLNLINNELNIDKILLHAKDPYKAKYRLLINIRESGGLKF